MPELEIAIPRPQRWDEPFGRMTEGDVNYLLKIEPFCSIDTSSFPPTLPLRGILQGDTRIVRYEPGDLIVRESDYGNSAFLVLSGTVRVVIERLSPKVLGRAEPPRRSWRQAIAQLWQNAKLPEVRRGVGLTPHANGTNIRVEDGTPRVFVQDVPQLLSSTGTARLGTGEIFGELAAMTRTPRTATVLAEGKATLLEIRWQGLRDLMRRTPAIRAHVERLYRENSLRAHLRETDLLKDLPGPQLDVVATATAFESYGNFDWYTDFSAHRRRDVAEQIAAEPLIASEGDRPNGLYLIRSGFARVSQRHGHGHRTLAYIGKGQMFGLEELVAAYHGSGEVVWQNSLRAVGYVDVLRIPVDVVLESVFPNCKMQIAKCKLQIDESSGQSEIRNPKSEIGSCGVAAVDSSLLDFLADHRFLNGTQTMLIDLERCTRCDDCVRACATTHDNNPRFIRQGPTHDHVMVANACMHCVDPVCMIGCPTGAIARDADTGTVRIDDRTCIGCSTCANSCPYSAIRMVEIREPGGAFYIDEATQLPILKATKCDFCTGQLTGPACQAACPHDALIRLDMGNLATLEHWIAR